MQLSIASQESWEGTNSELVLSTALTSGVSKRMGSDRVIERSA